MGENYHDQTKKSQTLKTQPSIKNLSNINDALLFQLDILLQNCNFRRCTQNPMTGNSSRRRKNEGEDERTTKILEAWRTRGCNEIEWQTDEVEWVEGWGFRGMGLQSLDRW